MKKNGNGGFYFGPRLELGILFTALIAAGLFVWLLDNSAPKVPSVHQTQDLAHVDLGDWSPEEIIVQIGNNWKDGKQDLSSVVTKANQRAQVHSDNDVFSGRASGVIMIDDGGNCTTGLVWIDSQGNLHTQVIQPNQHGPPVQRLKGAKTVEGQDVYVSIADTFIDQAQRRDLC